MTLMSENGYGAGVGWIENSFLLLGDDTKLIKTGNNAYRKAEGNIRGVFQGVLRILQSSRSLPKSDISVIILYYILSQKS